MIFNIHYWPRFMSWAKWVSWRADAPAGVCAKIMGRMLCNDFKRKCHLFYNAGFFFFLKPLNSSVDFHVFQVWCFYICIFRSFKSPYYTIIEKLKISRYTTVNIFIQVFYLKYIIPILKYVCKNIFFRPIQKSTEITSCSRRTTLNIIIY